MKRLFPLAALLCLPVLTIGCAPEDEVADPVAVDPVEDPVAERDLDLDATPVESGSGTAAVTSGSGMAAVAPADADFDGQVVFSVPDMTCPFSCAPEVESTLAGLPGVLGVETDVPSRTATIKVAKDFDVEAAKAALAGKQFPVDNVVL